MKKKVIAVLLSLSLAAGSVPGYAMAEEPGGPEGEIVVIDEGEAVPAAEDVVESPAADDAVIVEDGVEIAGIEELEIPAEDAVSEDEPVVTDEVAVDAAEVSEDPEIELVEDGEAEEVAEPDNSEAEFDKTTDAAYKTHNETDSKGILTATNVAPRLIVSFRDREKSSGVFADFAGPIVNKIDSAANDNIAVGTKAEPVENLGQRYYWIDSKVTVNVPTAAEAVYDPTYKKTYDALDPTEGMGILPELELTWFTDPGVDNKKWVDTDKKTTLQAGRDYTYELVNVDKVTGSHEAVTNLDGHAGDAVIEITFCGHYKNITKLMIKYTIVQKSMKQNIGDEFDRVIIDISDKYNESDKAYHFTYDGKEHRPTITSVTYKGEALQEWKDAIKEPDLLKDGWDWYRVTSTPDGKTFTPTVSANKNIKFSSEDNYEMYVKGLGNYKEYAEYDYVIDQREVLDTDVDRLNNATFYVELDEHEVEKRIRENLVNTLESIEEPKTLDTTEGRNGYKIYYYKVVKGEEVPFTTKYFEGTPGVNDDGTGAPGFDEVGTPNGVFDPATETRVKASDKEKVEAIKGEYRYYIEFTGDGNFRKKLHNESPIKGTFFITDKEPHLTDVYNSVKKDLVNELRNVLKPTYDATDWFKREGGSVDDPNDVEETVKNVFNRYTYYKRAGNGEGLVPCRAGDNIEVSLHPKHNGKMVNADRNEDGFFKDFTSDSSDGYVIRIKGINDWKDDLDEDGYIDMDEPDELIYVNPRPLTVDAAPGNYVDYDGEGARRIGDYIDRFYITDGHYDTTVKQTDYTNPEKYFESTDPYKVDDVYKYGAVQYLTKYMGSTFGTPEVTITHLVRNTKDAVEDDYKNYPLAVNQSDTPLYVGHVTATGAEEYSTVRAREKKLEVTKDFDIVTDSKLFGAGLTTTEIKGKGNYTGTIKVPTFRMKMINLENAGNVTVRVKSITPPDKYNKNVVQYSEEEGGLDLHYGKGPGIDVLPKNVEVVFHSTPGNASGDQIIAPKDYNVVIDTRNGDDMICQNCQKIDNVGTGRHVHVGLHRILVKWSDRRNVTGFQEAEFYIRSELDFSTDYVATLDAPEGYTVPVGVKLPVGQAPHDYVKVRSAKSQYVELSYGDEYEYECYIPAAQWDAYQKGDIEEPEIAKYRMNVRDGVEFEQEGAWYLVLKPVNTSNTQVEYYEGYVTCPFTVSKKSFQTPDKNGTISAVVKDEYKDGITWPGHNITGPEIAKMLRVDDTEKIVDTELKYGVDYTIDGTVDKVGDSVPVTLKGMGSYNGEDAITVNIKVNPGSLKNAKIELTGNLYYKGEAFNGELGAIDRAGLGAKVTVATDDMNNVLPESDYTVVVEGEDETGKAGTNVTVKVKAVSVANGGHYVDETADASATTVIQKADIRNEDLFKLNGMPTEPKVHTTEPVTLTLTLTDNRNGKTVELKTEYVGNDKAGTATVTITPADTDNYTGDIPGSFTIVDEELSGRIELKAESFPFKEDNYVPADVIKAVYDKNGTEITSDKYTAVIKGDAKNAGKAAVVVTTTIDGKSVSLEKTFTIEPRKITNVTNLEATYVYNRNVIRPDVKVEADGIILQNKDYVIYNTEDPNVGAKEIVVQAIGNYTGNIAKQFTVVPASVEGASITGVKASYKYNGTARQPKVKVTVNGKVLKKDVDYKVTYSADSTAVGGKTATIEGTGNYTGSQVKAYSVVPAKAVVKSVKAGKKRQLTVKVNAQAGVTYQIQYKVSGDDTWSSAKATGTKKVLKGLKSGKKYDIRVRAFATIDGARVNGAWSKVTVKKVK